VRVIKTAAEPDVAYPRSQKWFHDPTMPVPAIHSCFAVSGQMNMHINWSAHFSPLSSNEITNSRSQIANIGFRVYRYAHKLR
jgi:hypothetical protein